MRQIFEILAVAKIRKSNEVDSALLFCPMGNFISMLLWRQKVLL